MKARVAVWDRAQQCLIGVVAATTLACGGSSEQITMPPDQTNEPPRVGSFPLIADHDLEYRVELAISDPEGEPVSVEINALPDWLSFDSESRVLSGTPGEGALGTAPLIHVVARDASGGIGFRSDTVRVRVGTSRLDPRGPWVGWTPHPLQHDGAPVESEHFLVYSGYVSQEGRERLSDYLEEAYAHLMTRLDADEAVAEFPPDGRLHVFADKLQADAAFGASTTTNGWAFPDGMLVMSDEAPRFARGGYTDVRWKGLVMHELMHDVEFLLNGRDLPVTASDVWFREGIATYMPGLAPGGIPLSTVSIQTLRAWRTQMAAIPGGGNPIGVHLWGDFPAPVLNAGTTGNYYMWFAMTVMYLSDDAGFGLGDIGLRAFYDDQRGGLTFAESFRKQTGITLEQFEAEWWDRMEDFLS